MIRPFTYSDLTRCAAIVNKIWNFSTKFKPEPLSDLFLDFYTGGSLSASNLAVVVEEHNVVKGFLFGKCGNEKLIKTGYSGLWGKIKFLLQLFFLKGVSLKKKWYYLNIAAIHENNRLKVEPSRENEVNLFAVDPDTQGKGYGKMLMNEFIAHCRKNNISRVTLDSDKDCNTGFYDQFGFKVKGTFDSPLQKEYSGKSGLSIVYELKLY